MYLEMYSDVFRCIQMYRDELRGIERCYLHESAVPTDWAQLY